MIHERPGVWSAFGAQGTTELTDRRLAAVIAPADAAEGVQLVHSAAEAVSLYGGNALLTRMLQAVPCQLRRSGLCRRRGRGHEGCL